MPATHDMSGAGASAILLYHSLDETGGLFATSPALFRRHLEAVVEARIEVAPLSGVQDTGGALALTFDDGHRNFLDYGLPELLRHRMPATLFIVSDYCGREAGALTWNQVREIAAAGITIGAHSRTHRDLTRLSDADSLDEMSGSQRQIEDRLGAPVRCFSYPYGHSNALLRQQTRGLFDLACGTKLMQVDRGADPFNLPRVFDFYVRNPYWVRRLAGPDGRAYLALRRTLSRARRNWLG